jgi:protein TonB
MKKLLFLTFLLYAGASNGQKVYLDKNKVSIADSSAATYYKLVEYSDNTNAYKELLYYITGEKESENYFIKNSDKFVKNGKSLSWHKNGQLKSENNYTNGKLQGKVYNWLENGQLKSEIEFSDDQHNGLLVTNWENGKIKRKDVFVKGKFVNGTCYDSLGNKIEHFDYEIMPQYKGGDKQLLNDIWNKTNYPVRLRDAGIQGRVVVRFVVTEDGSISNVSIMEGANPEFNNEAIRVVETLKKFKPGYCDGEPVPVYYMVPITFSIR